MLRNILMDLSAPIGGKANGELPSASLMEALGEMLRCLAEEVPMPTETTSNCYFTGAYPMGTRGEKCRGCTATVAYRASQRARFQEWYEPAQAAGQDTGRGCDFR